jgi:aldose 1-epimerase
MFEIREENREGLNRLLIVNNNSREYISVIPDFGANVNEIHLKKGNRLHAVLAGNQTRDNFNGSGIFNSAKMLPFPNRIADGHYQFNGRSYQLEKNFSQEGNAIHGLIYFQKFELIRQDVQETYAEGVLGLQCENLHPGFPFRFKVECIYRLDSSGEFTGTTKVINNGSQSFPFGEGWHPFFGFNTLVDQLSLQFNAQELILVDERLIPTGRKVRYDKFNNLRPIADTLFDSCFRLAVNGHRHTSVLYDHAEDLRVELWQETGERGYHYLQVYIPPSRQSIALEPMTCNVNAFNNKEGLIILEPGDTYLGQYGVRLT